jgi:HEAT repeat protein
MLGRRPNIERLKKREDAAGLIEAAATRDLVEGTRGEVVDLAADTRREAVRALGELPGDPLAADGAVEAVMGCLQDSEEEVALAAVEALGRVDSPEAYPMLVAAAATLLPAAGHHRARQRAVEALAAYGAGAAPDLARSLVERDDGAALGADDADTLNDLLHHTTGAVEATPQLIEVLVGALRGSRLVERERAQQALSWYASSAVDPLLEALDDPDVRPSAAAVLGASRDVRAVPQLAECLSDPDVETRRAAARALGELTSPRAVEPLLRATDDEDFRVRSEAVAALDRLGTVGVVVGIETLARKGAPRLEEAEEYQRTLRPPPQLEGEEEEEPARITAVPDAEPRVRPIRPEPRTPAARREEPRRARREAEHRPAPYRTGVAAGGPLWPGLRRVLDAGRDSRRPEEAGNTGS